MHSLSQNDMSDFLPRANRRDMLRLSLGAAAGVAASANPLVSYAASGVNNQKDTPIFVADHYRPVTIESGFKNLSVRGAVPPSLAGRYLRTGHNPKSGNMPKFWFAGNGMVHGVRLNQGRAEWYRNRWVDTPALHGAPLFSKAGKLELTASAAGTSVIAHAGRIFALQEVNLPFELTPELDTVGAYDFGGALKTMMTAHPKVCPKTGDMLFFGNSPFAPHLTYHVANRQGALVHSEVIEGPGPSVIHDFAITENYVLWFDPNITLNLKAGRPFPYTWDPAYQARIGVMPRDRSKGAVRWITVDPFFMFHFGTAFERPDGSIVVEGSYYDQPAWEHTSKWVNNTSGHGQWPVGGARHARWTIDPARRAARVSVLDDLSTDFQTIDSARLGQANRYTYAVAFPDERLKTHALVKFDAQTGQRDVLQFKPGLMPSEPCFIADPQSSAEGDGWVLSYVSDLAREASELWILDASRLNAPPVAVVEIPVRIAAGVRGSWIADAALMKPM